MRLLLALLSSALTATLLQVFANLAPDFPRSLGRLQGEFDFLPIFFLLGALAALFLGLPAFLVTKHFKLANIWTSATAGLVIGGLIYLFIPSMPFEDGPQPLGAIDLIRNYCQFGGIGLVSGVAFWLARDVMRPKKAPAEDTF